jgi:hypothetical protein
VKFWKSIGDYKHLIIYDQEVFAVTTGDAKPTKTTADILCQHLKEILEDSGSTTRLK